MNTISDWRAVSDLLALGQNSRQLVALDNTCQYDWQDFAGAVATLLNTLGGNSGGRWLLYTDNSYQFAVGLMALLHAGKTVLLPINAQPATLAEWGGQCDGLLGVDGGEDVESLLIPLRGDPSRQRDMPVFSRLDADACAIEVVTSGSTGQAQVIKKSLRCFEQELAIQHELWKRELETSTFFSTVSHQHIYGLLFRLFLPLCSGRPFWAGSHRYPEQLLADIARHQQPAVLVASPAHLGRLPPLLDGAAASRWLRLITSSGGPLSFAAAQDSLARLGTLPVEVLGSTETGGVAWRQQARADQPWTAFPGVAVSADPESGQLTVRSPFSVQPAGFVMGDVVHFLEDGSFVLKGRADRVVKIEEKRLSLTAMEQHLQASPWVAQARLLLLPGRRQQLAAAVELSPAGREALAVKGKLAVNALLKQGLLAHYERLLLPRKWRYPESMPVNSQGKLPLADLVALFDKT